MDQSTPVATAMTVEECRSVEGPLREGLEVFDYEVRSTIAKLLGEADRSGVDSVLFLKAAGTVLLSVAASLLANAAEDEGLSFGSDAFVRGARDAAEWAKMKKLRYSIGGEA